MIKGSIEETERYEDLEEQGYKIGSLGEEAKQVKDQQIEDIDKEQDILLKEQTPTRSGLWTSPIRDTIERMYESEIRLLWRKISIYEKYAAEERNLRIQAVKALRRHEEQLLGSVKEIVLPKQEPRTGRWSRPSIKMMWINLTKE